MQKIPQLKRKLYQWIPASLKQDLAAPLKTSNCLLQFFTFIVKVFLKLHRIS